MKNLLKLLSALAVVVAGLYIVSCRAKTRLPLATVHKVDIHRYLGTWYEVARYPNSFERNCVGVTATYSLRNDGLIKVYNHAHLYRLDGKQTAVTGKAKIADTTSNAKLRVSFFGPFYADYWIIALGDEYEYAVVSEPSRNYLWILSRTPQMDVQRYQHILAALSGQGFDISRLVITPQAAPLP